MPATIFAGSKVKALKSTLSLNGGADVISSATDPTSVAVDAAIGSLLLNTTSGKLYKKLDAGSSTNWQEVGAGTGGKNYITKGSFDTASTSGWSLAASTLDATTKLPNQASGSWTAAAGTLSITTVGGGSQLSLLPYSLSLVSSAATTAGNMLVSDALALDLEAQASIQTFSFFYKVVSGSPTLAGNSTNSIAVAVYDVTNGAWIDPAGRYNVVQISGVAKCAGTFQVPSNCTSVRLAVYFPNASAGAITVYLDDFYLGPQVVQYGAPVTDWQAYTPTTQGFGTITNVDVYWRRVGSDLQVRGSFTTGTVTAAGARVNFPSGLTSTTDTVQDTIIGTYGRGGTTSSHGGFILKQNGASYVGFGPADTFGSTSNASLSTQLATAVVGSGEKLSFEFFCPILGWSSSVQMSNDTDTRVVAARIFKTTNQGPFAVETKLTGYTVDRDSHGMWDSTNNRFNIPVPGDYQLYITTNSVAATTATQVVAYKVNGGSTVYLGNDSANSAASRFSGSGIIPNLKAGDYVEIYQFTSANVTVQAGTTGTFASLTRISGPSAIAASESVICSYASSAGNALTAATPTLVVFATKEIDTHGFYNTSTGLATIPVSGKYRIAALLTSNGVTMTTGQTFDVHVYKNGSIVKHLFGAVGNGASTTYRTGGSAVLNLVAGDTIGIYGQTSNASTLFPNAVYNYLSIERIGN